MTRMLVDGHSRDSVAVLDRGFQYGDGIFTTLRVVAGSPLFLDLHLQRLARDAGRLGLPEPDRALLTGEVRALIGDCRDGVLKIMLTRGIGGRGYRPPDSVAPTRVLALHPPVAYPPTHATAGVTVRYCHTRLGINPSLAGIKHLNRLEQVLARSEWSDPEVAEGIMLDAEGFVVEGTQSNLFLVRDGCLLTPRLDRCGIQGVMRTLVWQAADRLGLACQETRLIPADLLAADEVFLSNSVIGLWPVRELIGVREYPVGPWTRKFRAWLHEAAERAAVPA